MFQMFITVITSSLSYPASFMSRLCDFRRRGKNTKLGVMGPGFKSRLTE